MKFGITLPHYAGFPSPHAVVEVAQRAEALGYDAVWVTDHIGVPAPYVARFGATFYEPLMVLGWVAAHTTRIGIGTSVIILPYRNPLHVAKAIATADHLSGGRVLFGVGAGWCQEEFAALGVPFQERGARTNEYLRLIKTVWTEEAPRFEGRYHRFADISWLPRPVQRPHPPIWVGGKSEAAMRRAAAFADVWHPNFTTPEELANGVGQFRELCRAAGRDPDAVGVAPRVHLQIHATRQPHSGKYPLVGSAEWVRENVEAYRKAGATGLVMDTFYGVPELGGETLASVVTTLETFAREIRPAVLR